jgi:hypothetical protein
MIVKHPFLLNTLINDIEFKKTFEQNEQERKEEEKRKDDESIKQCPKCLQNYIPSQTNYGSCHYHDGFIFDFDQDKSLSYDDAQKMTQQAKLLSHTGTNDPKFKLPKLMWACCMGIYGVDPPCRIGVCGIPEKLKGQVIESGKDQIAMVQKYFMNNPVAIQNIKDFNKTFAPTSTSTR